MRKVFLTTVLTAALVLNTVAVPTFAETTQTPTTDPLYEGYHQVWADEFNGDTLNRNDWNVELHDKGWVNSELQAYVDDEKNIYLEDGNLYLNPVKTVTVVETDGNLLDNADFARGMESWTETIANWGGADGSADAFSAAENGRIIYTINSPGNADWNVQLKQAGIPLLAGHTYQVNYKVTSDADRSIKSGVMSASYEWFGGSDPVLTAGAETLITFEFTMPKDEAGDFYISMGQITGEETPAGTVTISELDLRDLNAESTGKEMVSYTSGRISTQNKVPFTYGLFECRAKVPEGQGFLPAFWLMANDENIYGQWPRCGEIDCMEVMGQDTRKLYGTIHYGNPHSESQGTYTLTGDDSFSDDFHTFACEWEPGSIKWYVDGQLYHQESDWYSTTEGQGTLTYPAPFDQPFYIILNLAVGGSWVGNPDENTSFEDNAYVIDYVRVYQKDSYDENVTRPEKEIVLRDPDAEGNYINNGTFAEAESLTDDVNWKFLTALGGEAEASIADNTMTITTANEGTVDYSVQLVQADLPLEKGAEYQVQFDAAASAEREMGVDVKGPDHGYMAYMPHQTAKLTTAMQTYTYTFRMTAGSDANGRLEYNMGAAGSTADIRIQNVSVKKIKDADPNEKEEKTVLANGSYVYNGSFREGTGHLGYWTLSNGEGADVTVTPFADGRRLQVAMKEGAQSAVVLSQDALGFKDGTPYVLSFTAQSDRDNTLTAVLGGHTFTARLKAGEKETFAFPLPAEAEYTDRDIAFTFGTEGTTWLDDVKLMENAMIKNGSFNDGTTGYEIYIDNGARAGYVVDSLQDDNALAVTVDYTGDLDWKVQIMQNNVTLEQGKTYKLTFRAKSDLDRKIKVVMQGKEPRGYAIYSHENILDLTDEYQLFEDVFTMEEATDTAAFFSACLGAVNEEISTQHEVRIDDICLVEVNTQPGEEESSEDTSEEESSEEITQPETQETPGETTAPETQPETKPGKKPTSVQKVVKQVVKVVVKAVTVLDKLIRGLFGR